MAQVIHSITQDNGDGTASVLWFRTKTKRQLLKLMDSDPEQWGANEGHVDTYTFPDDLDLEKCGFSFDDENV